jgi:hypothetical protein
VKDLFPGYYRPSSKDFVDLWNTCTFVLDANVLLNLYRYSPNARAEFLKTLDKISERLWIPNQVALEYQNNRLTVISEEINKCKEIKTIIANEFNDIRKRLNNEKYNRRNTYTSVVIKSLQEKIDKNSKECIDEIGKFIENQPKWIENDEIRDQIGKLFEGKIGSRYPQEKLIDLYRAGDERFALRIPPGYMDARDSDKEGLKKYGDYILWVQTIEMSKEHKKPIIFITDDTKEDWWLTTLENKPRPELIQEFILETEMPFFMYSSDRFLYYAKKQLKVEINEDTIKEIKQTRAYDETQMVGATGPIGPEKTLEMIRSLTGSTGPTGQISPEKTLEMIHNLTEATEVHKYYVVLQPFKGHFKGVEKQYEKGEFVEDEIAEKWPNFKAMLSTGYITEGYLRMSIPS